MSELTRQRSWDTMPPIVYKALDLFSNPSHTRWIAPLLLVFEAVLCGGIIWKIPYTEIDWATYMKQVEVFLNGERRYEKLTGPTGPCVYPAMHVYIYSALYYATERGKDIMKGQIFFALLYLATLALVLQCYRRVNAPPWLLAPLVLSKRLHSVFMLRMFNDCFAAFFFWLAIYLLHRRKWGPAAFVWGVGVGVKMTLLLAAPGLAIVLLHGAGMKEAVTAGMAVVGFQAIIGTPFLQNDAKMYLKQAFDFGRVFLFKWTVNWRFLGESIFLDKGFAVALLVVHISLLLAFAHAKWVRMTSRGLPEFIGKCLRGFSDREQKSASQRLTSIMIMDASLTSMVVGLLCARSLHYQFYAYLAWATPYLLWRAGGEWMWTLLNWAIQEVAWNIFPSTSISSMVVVSELAIQVLSVLIAPLTDEGRPAPLRSSTDEFVPRKSKRR